MLYCIAQLDCDVNLVFLQFLFTMPLFLPLFSLLHLSFSIFTVHPFPLLIFAAFLSLFLSSPTLLWLVVSPFSQSPFIVLHPCLLTQAFSLCSPNPPDALNHSPATRWRLLASWPPPCLCPPPWRRARSGQAARFSETSRIGGAELGGRGASEICAVAERESHLRHVRDVDCSGISYFSFLLFFLILIFCSRYYWKRRIK